LSFVQKVTKSFIGTVVLGITNLAIGIILARVLLPDGVGQYQLVISTSIIISAMATLGVGQSTVFFINRKNYDKQTIGSLSFIYGVIIASSVFIFLNIILLKSDYFGEIPFYVRLAVGLYGACLTLVQIVYPILLTDYRVIQHQLTNIIPRLILLCLVIALWLSSSISISNAYISTAFGQAVGLVAVLTFLRKDLFLRSGFDWKLCRSMIGYGLKLNLAYVVTLLNGELGILLLRFFQKNDFSQIGYYSRSVRLGAMLLLIVSATGPLLYSKWSSTDLEQTKLQAEKVCRVYFCLLVVVLIFIESFAHHIINFLYGSKFLPAVSVLRLLIIGVGARFLLSPFFELFAGNSKAILTSLILAVILILMVVLMIFLVPTYKAVGAAMSYTIANFAGFIMGLWIVRKNYGIRFSKCVFATRSDIISIIQGLSRKTATAET
jgi:O-antigen/teichoic acid export membrane protein